MWPTWSTATALDQRRRSLGWQFLQLSSYGNVWFIYIACSRQVPPRRLNQSAPEIVIISSGGLYRHCYYKNSLLARLGRQRGQRLLYGLMNETHSRPRPLTVRRLALQRMHAIVSGFCPSCVGRSILPATTKE